jgi:hypothetical protein
VIGYGACEGEGEEVDGDGSDGLELGNSRDRAAANGVQSKKPKRMVPGGPLQVLPMEDQCSFQFRIRIDR